jgi:hypothetical protein
MVATGRDWLVAVDAVWVLALVIDVFRVAGPTRPPSA